MNDEDRKDLIRYRIVKARKSYDEISNHVENKLWNTAVNRLYYACYYAVSALLIDNKITTSTHAGVRQMFGLHFIKTGKIEKDLGKFYSDIFDLRQAGDYEDYIDFAEDDVLDLLDPANRLITRIEIMLD